MYRVSMAYLRDNISKSVITENYTGNKEEIGENEKRILFLGYAGGENVFKYFANNSMETMKKHKEIKQSIKTLKPVKPGSN